MKTSVLLVQRGVVSQTHPVCGKSLKAYGTAIFIGAHKGVVLKMSLEDYTEAAHDLIGNSMAGQQWVPEFVPEHASNRTSEKCGIPSGCRFGVSGKPAEAAYVYDRYYFCPAHAPNNATALFDGAPPIGEMPASSNGAHHHDEPDVQPRIVDRGSGAQIQEMGLEAPKETITPIVGTAAENAPDGVLVGGIEKPVPMPTFPTVTRRSPPLVEPLRGDPGYQEALQEAAAAKPPTFDIRPEAATATPKSPPVAEVLNAMVENAVAKQMTGLEERIGRMISLMQPLKTAKPKTRQVAAQRPPTEMQLCQQRARELGINPFQKSRAELERLITDAVLGQQGVTASEAETVFSST